MIDCRYNVALGKIAKLDGHQTVLKVQIARLRLQVSCHENGPCVDAWHGIVEREDRRTMLTAGSVVV